MATGKHSRTGAPVTPNGGKGGRGPNTRMDAPVTEGGGRKGMPVNGSRTGAPTTPTRPGQDGTH